MPPAALPQPLTSALPADPPSAEAAASAVHLLLHALGEDTGREGLRDTPKRVAKALSFLTSGHHTALREVLNGAIFREAFAGLVLVKDIEFYSLCEHHLLPFHGKVHVAYYPEGRVLGLSKLPRLVDMFARRLQVQERLTQQVAQAVDQAIHPRGVAVLVEAAHFCMMMRGVEKQHSATVTTAFLGCFESTVDLRQDFLASVRGAAPPASGPKPARDPRPDAHAHAPVRPGFPAQYRAGPPSFVPPTLPRLYGTGPPRRPKGGAKPPRGHRCEQCRETRG